jgi:hypothetical protein
LERFKIREYAKRLSSGRLRNSRQTLGACRAAKQAGLGRASRVETPQRKLGLLEHVHKLFNGLEKARCLRIRRLLGLFPKLQGQKVSAWNRFLARVAYGSGENHVFILVATTLAGEV